MKILFSGGGTLGPVTPLLAIREVVLTKYSDASFFWVGTKTGPEKMLVEEKGIKFAHISSGKMRRYFSIWNIIDVFSITRGFLQSVKILLKEKPDVCISAGGYVSVPLHWAAWFLGIPTWIHQQDFNVGLANSLMKRVATQITTALEQQVVHFPKRKTKWIGNPVRKEIISGEKNAALQEFGLDADRPVIFVTGGGTGSLRVNQLTVEALPGLLEVAQIIHLSGKERPQELVEHTAKLFPKGYHLYQFFTDEMKDAYAAADIIISRGGFGTLTEIAALGKVAIIIPKPGHQVQNVRYLESKGAAVYVNEKTSDGLYLVKVVKEILWNQARQKQLSNNLKTILPRVEDNVILEICESLVSKHRPVI